MRPFRSSDIHPSHKMVLIADGYGNRRCENCDATTNQHQSWLVDPCEGVEETVPVGRTLPFVEPRLVGRVVQLNVFTLAKDGTFDREKYIKHIGFLQSCTSTMDEITIKLENQNTMVFNLKKHHVEFLPH